MQAFNKTPCIDLKNQHKCFTGWDSIGEVIRDELTALDKEKKVVVIETYQGIYYEEVRDSMVQVLDPRLFVDSLSSMHKEAIIREMVYPDVTDDRIFGYLTRLDIKDYFDDARISAARNKMEEIPEGLVIVFCPGASYVADEWDLLIYADMARWEIQQRMRRNEVDNLGLRNRTTEDWMLLYKQGYFVDWRVLDRLKKRLMERTDFLLDTNDRNKPKMLAHSAVSEAYDIAVTRPFSVVPFFDPGPWGGQWMKEVCDLDPNEDNYAWCFNCVPEENSLLVRCGEELVEIPSINLVFRHPKALLGEPVHARFGDEFPIRYDYLDTMDGGNLSLQVHPLTEYIQEKFGMHYTQDESYYLMDAREGAVVYLGLKVGVDPAGCISDLKEAGEGETLFNDERHIQTWPARKHDHFLIPAGTIHCSGKNSMVLEISATPYIFTFKLWDWGRLGMDGKPRPINIKHGEQVIQWNRTTSWTKENLVNRIEQVAEGDGWREERTGLHEREFIETRRHWFTKTTHHVTGGGVNVIALVEGDQIVVESPDDSFEPFVVNYAEVFIVPASVEAYTMRPYGPPEGKQCVTIKSYVRF